eukprot:Sspe_Gene.15728::Locus_5487_Transcript_1_2_Confidence_0.400_Length_1424::g.15728::m.15728
MTVQPVLLHVLGSLDGLGDGPNLVDLEQQRVARPLLDGLLDALHVGHSQVIPDNLGLVLQSRRQTGPRLPVVLPERVLDGDDRVLLHPLAVHLGHLLPRDQGLLVALEGEVVLPFLLVPHLRGCAVHADLDLPRVPCLLDGLHKELKRFLTATSADGGSEAALVTHVHGIDTVVLLDDGLQLVVDLAPHAHRLVEVLGPHRGDHVLLEGERVPGVRAPVDHVEARDRELHSALVPGELRDVLVQRKACRSSCGLADGHGDTEDGVGTKVALVLRAIELDHELVQLLLLHHVLPLELLVELPLHSLHSLLHPLPHEAVLVTVPLLARLTLSRRSTARD